MVQKTDVERHLLLFSKIRLGVYVLHKRLYAIWVVAGCLEILAHGFGELDALRNQFVLLVFGHFENAPCLNHGGLERKSLPTYI